MKQEDKIWIDNASYKDLLYKWRVYKIGDPIFSGEDGAYFSKVMLRKKEELTIDEQVRISKQVGWE